MVAYEDAAVGALGDPTRRAIFERLAAGPLAVGELARDLPVSRPAVSQHLRVLKDAGLVTDRRIGNRRVYQLDPAGVGAVRAYFDRFWNQALAAFADASEEEERRSMAAQTTDQTVRSTVTVEASQERAFDVFTQRMATWWPSDYQIGGAPMEQLVVEPQAGGRWFERAADGSETEWGRVLAWDPPRRLVLSWGLTPEWTPDPDPARASEIEVRFTSEGDSRTRVELEHRGFERHGPGGDGMRQAVSGGWPGILQRYAETAGG